MKKIMLVLVLVCVSSFASESKASRLQAKIEKIQDADKTAREDAIFMYNFASYYYGIAVGLYNSDDEVGAVDFFNQAQKCVQIAQYYEKLKLKLDKKLARLISLE